MLKILNTQLRAFEQSEEHRFIQRVSTFLTSSLGLAAPIELLEHEVSTGIVRARLHGLTLETTIVEYIVADLMLRSCTEQARIALMSILSSERPEEERSAQFLNAAADALASLAPQTLGLEGDAKYYQGERNIS